MGGLCRCRAPVGMFEPSNDHHFNHFTRDSHHL
jgi:hypothetical protein